MELVCYLLSADWGRSPESKTYASYGLVQGGPIVVAGGTIISSSSLVVTPAESGFSGILLKSVVSVTITTVTLSLERFWKFSTKCRRDLSWLGIGLLWVGLYEFASGYNV